MIEASQTEVIPVTSRKHTFMRQERKRISPDEFTDFLDTVAVADEFLRSMNIHTIEASILERSACNTDMYLGCTRLTKHLHNLQGSGTTYY